MGWDNTNTWAYIIKTDATVLIKVYHSIIDNTGYIELSYLKFDDYFVLYTRAPNAIVLDNHMLDNRSDIQIELLLRQSNSKLIVCQSRLSFSD